MAIAVLMLIGSVVNAQQAKVTTDMFGNKTTTVYDDRGGLYAQAKTIEILDVEFVTIQYNDGRTEYATSQEDMWGNVAITFTPQPEVIVVTPSYNTYDTYENSSFIQKESVETPVIWW